MAEIDVDAESTSATDDQLVTMSICEMIVNRDYCDRDASITVDDLCSRAATCPENMPEDEFRLLTAKIGQLIKAMASSDMNSKQMEAFLTSQTKRRPKGSTGGADVVIDEARSAALAKFWMANRSRVHQAILCRSAPTNYGGMTWRTQDIPIRQHRSSAETATAVVQIRLKNSDSFANKAGEDSFSFQLDSNRVGRLIERLDEVDDRLSIAAANAAAATASNTSSEL